VIDPRTPVLVGAGTSLDDAEAVELMVAAATAAGADAGSSALLAAVEQVAVPRGTWSYTDPGRIVAERVGAAGARTVLVDLGIPQQTLVNEAMAAIAAGTIDVALVVGGEAKARQARAAARSTRADAAGIAHVMRRPRPTEGEHEATEIDQHGAQPDVHMKPRGEIVSREEIDAGLWAPVEQYALIESALGAAEGLTLAEQRRRIAELSARFNLVARDNPEAAFAAPRDADSLERLDGANRPLAFPYGKWHASQWTVDQAAALLLCSVAAAEDFDVPRDRWVFPLVGVDSSFAVPLVRRRELHRWPAMAVLGQAASERIGRPLAGCEHVEVYSCFPSAVRVQQHELDLPLGATPTITGGMAFAGGPFNSFVLQATVAMARRLRDDPGLGLVTTVSGFLTKPGLAVWASEPDDRPPLLADLAPRAAAVTDTVKAVTQVAGEASIVATTVTYDASEPSRLVAVVEASSGAHAVVRSDDDDWVTRGVTESLIGQSVVVRDREIVA
jgi:acetyl-CoA C-acetyltransferase